MSRRTLALLCLVLGASPALAADDLSDFAFPEMDFDTVASQNDRSLLERAAAPSRSVSAAAAQVPSATVSLLPVGESPAVDSSNSYTSNSYASPSDLPAAYGTPQPVMLTYGPSQVSPLLAYMQCDPYSCGDVWAGFAAQHAADRAAYCALPNCHCGGQHAALHAVPCTSGCDGANSHTHHRHVKPNRYTQLHATPDMGSIGCGAGCVK